jgi:hypothetical protein
MLYIVSKRLPSLLDTYFLSAPTYRDYFLAALPCGLFSLPAIKQSQFRDSVIRLHRCVVIKRGEEILQFNQSARGKAQRGN